MDTIRRIMPTLLLISTYSLGLTIFTPYISPYLSSLGFANSTIGYMYAGGALSIIAIAPIIGRLSDILGRKRIITIALFIEVLALTAFIYLNITFAIAIAVLSFAALGIVMLELTLLSQVEDKIKDKSRGIFTGIYESLRTVGVVLGPLVGAAIVVYYPVETTFKLTILIFSILIFVNIFTKEKIKTKEKPHLKDFNFIKEIRSYWANRHLKGVAIIGMSTNFASRGSIVFLPLLIVQDLNAPLAYVGIIAALGMSINLFQFIHGWLCDKIGCEKFIILGPAIAATAYILISTVDTYLALIPIMILFSLGASLWSTSAVTFVSSIGERNNNEGQTVGVYGALSSIGIILTFIVSGLFISSYSLQSLFALYGILIFVALLISFRYILIKAKPQRNPLF